MKKLLVFACMASMVFAGQALAQCNPDPNEVCILFDNTCGNCETGNCLSFVGGAAAAYVVLMNPSQAAGASGYEFCLCNEDGSPFAPPAGASIFVTGYTYPPNAINAATEPCFAVGLATPIGASPCMTLLTINLLLFDPTPWCFGMSDVGATASIPGRMAYADGGDPGLLIPLVPCTSAEETDCYMACVNAAQCPPPTAVEDATWGNVKAMYR